MSALTMFLNIGTVTETKNKTETSTQVQDKEKDDGAVSNICKLRALRSSDNGYRNIHKKDFRCGQRNVNTQRQARCYRPKV